MSLIGNVKIEMNIDSFISPRVDPLVHPGKRTSCSYLFADHKALYTIEGFQRGPQYALIEINGHRKNLNEYLRDNDVDVMEARIPLLAYGTNPCPGQLSYKFKSLDKVFIPVIKGTIKGWDTIYKFLFDAGYAYAQLIPSPHTVVETWITLLDKGQYEIMNKSEGIYNVEAEFKIGISNDFYTEDNVNVTCLFYVGNKKVFVTPYLDHARNTPIAIAEIPAQHRKFPALKQKVLLNHCIEIFGLQWLFEQYRHCFDTFAGTPGEQLARYFNQNYNLLCEGQPCNEHYHKIVNRIHEVAESSHCMEISASQMPALRDSILENPNSPSLTVRDAWPRDK